MSETTLLPRLENLKAFEHGQTSSGAATGKTVRVLAYVHLRNIHNSTGAGRVARQLTAHLAERSDIDLQVLADPSDHARIIPKVGAPWSDFRYHFIASETSRQQARWFLLNGPKAERYWSGAQIMFCTGESYVPVQRARLAITVHDAAYFEDFAHRRDRAFLQQRLKWKLLYRKLSQRADLFHSVSHFSAERLAHFFPSIRSRIRVVHNAVTSHFFEPVTKAGRDYLAQAGLDQRRFLLIPGGLHFRKNADLILQAWPRLQQLDRDLKLVVVNHSDPAYVEKLQALGGDIHIAGFVSDNALKALYTAAEAVWFPSRYEGFGLPVLEAMACGAPVVTSNASSLPEIAGDAALLADPGSAEAHLEALDGLLGSRALRDELKIRGRERALHFTWERAAAELKTHFDSIL
jgi:glycosyltransferase involved in cell wall biosynthesis